MSSANHPTRRDSASQTQVSEIEVPLLKALNIATRTQHTRLNQLILSRIPLALPPNNENPRPYAEGLLAFASIYYTFESAWQILSDYEPVSELPLETAVVLSGLIHLHIPALQRSERLCDDLSLLLDLPRSEIAFRIRHPSTKHTKDFVQHIRETARQRPHALVAYAWVLYMALFNGGRWIREQLSTARDISWKNTHPELTAALDSTGSTAGLTFWHFDSLDDGDDIKNDFNARLTDVGAMLSTAHKEDIVDEAKTIFERSAEIVLELDNTQQPNIPETALPDPDSVRWTNLHEILGLFIPMVIMQLFLVLMKRISGARIRAPLPFRNGSKKDE